MLDELISIERLSDYNDNIMRDANVLKRSTAYVLNDTVSKGLVILKCSQAGTTDSTTLSLSGVTVDDELTDGTAKWKVISLHGYGIGGGGGTGSGIAPWATATEYNVNDMVIYNDVIYKCNTYHTSSAFATDEENWDLVYESIQNWTASVFYKENSSVIYNHKLYQCITAHTSTSTFDGSKWQLIGDYVTAPIKVGEVGYVSWQYALLENHLALNGATVNDFNATYPELYDFFDDNSLITDTQATYDENKMLLLYDSSTDTAIMPDFRGLVPQGAASIGEIKAGLPNIKGTFGLSDANVLVEQGQNTGAFGTTGVNHVNYGLGTQISKPCTDFNASRSSSIYKDNVTTVQPPAAGLIPQIRYKKDTIEGSVGDFYNDTPIGTVISYMGTTPPREYLACDGTVYNISSYQALADFINDTFGAYNYFGGDGTTTFAVPDLRGEFLRGTGTNSRTTQGSGSNVGTHQDATKHINIVRTYEGGYYYFTTCADGLTTLAYGDYSISSNPNNNGLPKNVDSYDATKASHTWVGNSGSNTTKETPYFTSRPTNTSVLYCIKYTVAIVPKSIVDWQTSTEYEIGNIVIYDNIMYRCLADHTSGTFATDYANGKWQEIGETATTAQIEALFI